VGLWQILKKLSCPEKSVTVSLIKSFPPKCKLVHWIGKCSPIHLLGFASISHWSRSGRYKDVTIICVSENWMSGAERERGVKKYGGAGRSRSGEQERERGVSGERKFRPLPLRSHALVGDCMHVAILTTCFVTITSNTNYWNLSFFTRMTPPLPYV